MTSEQSDADFNLCAFESIFWETEAEVYATIQSVTNAQASGELATSERFSRELSVVVF